MMGSIGNDSSVGLEEEEEEMEEEEEAGDAISVNPEFADEDDD